MEGVDAVELLKLSGIGGAAAVLVQGIIWAFTVVFKTKARIREVTIREEGTAASQFNSFLSGRLRDCESTLTDYRQKYEALSRQCDAYETQIQELKEEIQALRNTVRYLEHRRES